MRNIRSAYLNLPYGRLIAIAVTVTLSVFLVLQIKIDGVASQLKLLSWTAVSISIVVIGGNMALGVLRLWAVLRDFGFIPGWSVISRASILGTLSGLIFFQFIGQTITRLAILKKFGVSASASFAISIYERLVSILALGAFALSGAIFIFGKISLNVNEGGSTLVIFVACGVSATLFAIWFGYRQLLRRALRAVNGREAVFSISRCLVITIFMQGLMLVAYVSIAYKLKPDISIVELSAAAAIVMFAAALPISFGGWGIRELSAVYAFGAIGFEFESALIVSIVVGALSQVLLALAAVGVSLAAKRKSNGTVRLSRGVIKGPQTFDFKILLFWGIPISAATAVLFQMKIPIGSQFTSVNIADPIVVLGAVVYLAQRGLGRWRQPYWKVPRLEAMMLALSGAFLVSFLIGFQSFGFTNWAVFNRLVGWGILLCYALTGALVVSAFGSEGRATVLRTFAVSAAGVTLAIWVLEILRMVSFRELGKYLPARFEGMAANPNAYAFQMLIAFVAILVLLKRSGKKEKQLTWLPYIGAIILTGLWFSMSRAGMITLAALLVAVPVLKITEFRKLLAMFVIAAVIVLLTNLLEIAGQMLNPGGTVLGQLLYTRGGIFEPENDGLRIASMRGAIELWLANPVFGGGLGSFFHKYYSDTGERLVIHNTPLWILAEFGIAGVLLFGYVAFKILKSAVVRYRSRLEPGMKLLILIFVVMGIMFTFHDMMFQRSFWLLFGVAIANPVLREKAGLNGSPQQI